MGGSRQAGDDVMGGDLTGRHIELGREAGAGQGHGLEVAAASLGLQRLEIQTGAAEQIDGDVALNPALDRNPLSRRILAQDVELGHAPGVGDRLPAIGRRRRLMDDQHPGRALTRHLLVFVGPAAIVGHGLAAEGVQGRFFEIGVIDQDDQHLAAQILPLEVVPIPLGRGDPIADEDQGRVLQADVLGRVAGREGDLASLGHRQGPVAQLQRRLDVGLGEAVQDHVLGPLAVRTARLEAGGGVLAAQIVDHLLLGRGGDAAPLETVVRQGSNVLGDTSCVEGRDRA